MGRWFAVLASTLLVLTMQVWLRITLPLALFQFGGAVGLTNYNGQMAMSVISIIPLLIIFLAFQRRFVEGITAGAVKG